MAGWLGSIFGKDPEKLMKGAENLASQERWPEAIEALEKALEMALDDRPTMTGTIRAKIREYSDEYLALLEEAIPRFIEDGNRRKAEELAEVAFTFTEDEGRKETIRGFLKKRTSIEEARAAEPPKPDKYPDELIDSLLHGYLESLEANEREEILKRPFVFQKAFVLWHQGEVEDARIAAEDHLAKNTDDPYAHFYLGLCFASLEKTDDAIRAFQAAVGLDPSLLPAVMGLAAMERRKQNFGRAIELLEKTTAIVRSDPDRFSEIRKGEVFHTTTQVLFEAGRLERGEELYRELIDEELIPRAIALEARLADRKGNVLEAEELWESLVRAGAGGGAIMGHGSHSSGAGPAEQEEAGDFFERNGKPKRALDLYEKAALKITERIHYAGEELGMGHLFRLKKKIAFLLIDLEKYEEAEVLAEELEGLDPVPPEAAEIRDKLEPFYEEE